MPRADALLGKVPIISDILRTFVHSAGSIPCKNSLRLFDGRSMDEFSLSKVKGMRGEASRRSALVARVIVDLCDDRLRSAARCSDK